MSRSDRDINRYEEIREENPDLSEDEAWAALEAEKRDAYWDQVDRGRQRAKDEGWRK